MNRLLAGLQGLLEVCVVRRVLNSGGEVLHGLLELTQAVEDQAPVVVGSRQPRPGTDSPFIFLDCTVKVNLKGMSEANVLKSYCFQDQDVDLLILFFQNLLACTLHDQGC